jgi:hypothetical protein
MVDGRLRCLGSAQHLKTKYGLGYQVELGLMLPAAQEVASHAALLSGQQPQQVQVGCLSAQGSPPYHQAG